MPFHASRTAFAAAVALAGLLHSGEARALLLYSAAADGATATGGYVSDADVGIEYGAYFSVTPGATLEEAVFYGRYDNNDKTPGVPDAFTLRFYLAPGGAAQETPELTAAVAVSREAEVNDFGDDVYKYTAALPDIVVADGLGVISFTNDTDGDDDVWFWQTASGLGGEPSGIHPSIGSGIWLFLDEAVVLDLYGSLPDDRPDAGGGAAVPLPPALALLGLALGALGFAARRRRS